MARLVTALVVLATLVLADSAMACSCAGGRTPQEKLADAKAAFVGRVVTKRDVTPQPEGEAVVPGQRFRYRIRVSRSFKRRLGRRIRMEATTDDASCGFEWRVGQRVAAYLYGRRGDWQTSLCSLERPRKLLRAARRGELGSAAGSRNGTCRAPSA